MGCAFAVLAADPCQARESRSSIAGVGTRQGGRRDPNWRREKEKEVKVGKVPRE
jgi:hypothetical protein